MRRRTLGLTLALVGFTVLALALYTYALPNANLSKTVTLEPSSGTFAQVSLCPGDKVQGTLDVTDGTAGIKVYVEDPPPMEVVYNGGTVYDHLEFSFNAQTSGVYRVNFENLSPANQQTIAYSLTFPSNPGVIGYLAITVGVLLLVVGPLIALSFRQKALKLDIAQPRS